jgi:hypothetical protein
VVEPATIAKQLGRVNTEVVIDAAPRAVVQKLASHAAEGGSNFARSRMNRATVDLEHVLGDIQTDCGNLHVDGSLM